MAVYTLPDLPYDFGALEPHISGEIMQLHHDKHHQAYVDGANKALEKLAEARESANFDNIGKLEKDLAFNLGGHVNHSTFWQNLTPDAQERPDGDLAAAIDEYFGSFDGFKNQFSEAAKALQGSGWAALVFDTLGKRLNVINFYDQQNGTPLGQTPLLLLDMWEHAYYLQYKNVKADYVKAYWNIINWADVAERFAKAQQAN